MGNQRLSEERLVLLRESIQSEQIAINQEIDTIKELHDTIKRKKNIIFLCKEDQVLFDRVFMLAIENLSER